MRPSEASFTAAASALDAIGRFFLDGSSTVSPRSSLSIKSSSTTKTPSLFSAMIDLPFLFANRERHHIQSALERHPLAALVIQPDSAHSKPRIGPFVHLLALHIRREAIAHRVKPYLVQRVHMNRKRQRVLRARLLLAVDDRESNQRHRRIQPRLYDFQPVDVIVLAVLG